MKKNILVLFAMSLIVSCSQVTSTTSNGFAPRDFPITMGSQSSVDVVIAMDKLWEEGDFDGMREHISDSARFVWEDGRVHSREEFINSLKSDTLMYSWTFDWAFSVKDDNPQEINEWVNAGFNVVETTKSGDTLGRAHYNEWYLINKDGKISFWFNTKPNR